MSNRGAPLGVTLGVAIALFACGDRSLPARGQLVIHVDTNAPLALPPGQALKPDDILPLFDTLRIELLGADGSLACPTCVQSFAVDRDMLARRAISFGVVRGRSAPSYVRGRLFRNLEATGDDIPADAVIDRVFSIPQIADEGVSDLTVFMPLEDVGKPAAIAGSTPATPGNAVRGEVHPAVLSHPCTGPASGAQACVRGGAFWMGELRGRSTTDGARVPSRVVAVRPFWLDRDEVTVAELRASSLATRALADEQLLTGEAGKDCTFGAAPGKTEAFPVTCITWTLARAYCEQRGARLPTEAEWEFAARGRIGSRYVWGNDDPTCEDSVVGRSDPADRGESAFEWSECANRGIGAAPVGTGLRDRLAVGSGVSGGSGGNADNEIRGLVGNVSEWTEDEWEEIGGPCWPAGLLIAPRCKAAVATDFRSYRGGGWNLPASLARSTARKLATTGITAIDIGVRCAKDGG